jgi:hypothetical protein
VLAFAREGHRKRDVNLRDLFDALSYRGFWRFLRKYPSMCWYELRRSLQRLVPEILPDDLATGGSGVRAQAIAPEGDLVQDFRLIACPNALHVLNSAERAQSRGDGVAGHRRGDCGDGGGGGGVIVERRRSVRQHVSG